MLGWVRQSSSRAAFDKWRGVPFERRHALPLPACAAANKCKEGVRCVRGSYWLSMAGYQPSAESRHAHRRACVRRNTLARKERACHALEYSILLMPRQGTSTARNTAPNDAPTECGRGVCGCVGAVECKRRAPSGALWVVGAPLPDDRGSIEARGCEEVAARRPLAPPHSPGLRVLKHRGAYPAIRAVAGGDPDPQGLHVWRRVGSRRLSA